MKDVDVEITADATLVAETDVDFSEETAVYGSY